MTEISRRTVVKAAAWTVPIITVGAAAPAMAATFVPVLEFDGRACKLPGGSNDIDKGYVLGLAVNNDFGVGGVEIRFQGFGIVNGTDTIAPYAIQQSDCSAEPLVIPSVAPYFCYPEGKTEIALYLEENGNSQNALIFLNYDVWTCGGGEQLLAEQRLEVQLSGDPVNGGCEPHHGWYTLCDIPDVSA